MTDTKKYTEHPDIPDFDYGHWDKDGKPIRVEGKLFWGSAEPPPSVGTKIVAILNNLGPAVVKGYFQSEGFLGLLVEFQNPPEWFLRQNRGDRKGHLFGPEFKRP